MALEAMMMTINRTVPADFADPKSDRLGQLQLDEINYLPPRAQRVRLKPKDAAAIILYDRADGDPRFLFGKRRADLKFMAGKFVFPGGQREATDAKHQTSNILTPTDKARLDVGFGRGSHNHRAKALAVAAIREFYEETGMMIGHPNNAVPLGFVPDLGTLRYVARAITPPGHVRRFDTRFFIAELSAVQSVAAGGPPDAEFDELRWANFAEAALLDLPEITRLILSEAVNWLAMSKDRLSEFALPTFRMRHRRFVREEFK
jgi:8-oxo-dGTP pyrophosphatase MutT (NUDIX family)